MRKYNINANLVCVIEPLLAARKNASEQLLKLGKDALLTHTLQYFSPWIISDAWEEHDVKISIHVGRRI